MVDGINDVDRRYIYQLMSNVKLPCSNIFDSQMQMHTGNQNNNVSLAKEFKHHLKKITAKVAIHGRKMDR